MDPSLSQEECGTELVCEAGICSFCRTESVAENIFLLQVAVSTTFVFRAFSFPSPRLSQ